MTRVALVSLGRASANGEVRRVASWRRIWEHAGAEVVEIGLSEGRRLHIDGLPAVLHGRAAPERLAWSGSAATTLLAELEPDVVVCVSSRAFDPVMLESAPTFVLDFVDCLSRSYSDRAALVGAARLGYRMLAGAHRRVERTLSADAVTYRVAAGRADAEQLGATWVPIVGDPDLQPAPGIAPDRDLVFVGTLRYPPNIDALETFARWWPELQRRRPGTTMLVAGANPAPCVLDLCRRHGWDLAPDFDSLSATLARARLAVAPLQRTAGVQIKVLDAAWLGLPQVATSAALAGYGSDFPLVPSDGERDFVGAVVERLDDPDTSRQEAEVLRRHVRHSYAGALWASRVADLFGIRRAAAEPIPV